MMRPRLKRALTLLMISVAVAFCAMCFGPSIRHAADGIWRMLRSAPVLVVEENEGGREYRIMLDDPEESPQ